MHQFHTVSRSELLGEQPLLAARERRRRPELMDQPGLNATEHARALSGLGRINRLSRSAAMYWPELRRLAQAGPGRPLRVLDVASGGGDVPIALARRAVRSGVNIAIEGCDKSAAAVQFAGEQAAARALPVRFFTLDALRDEVPSGFDVIVSSLFLHHLDDYEAVRLLERMAGATGKLIMINDLLRGPIEFALAWAGCRLLTGSRVVRHDGPVSVSAAFTITEARDLASRAGLEGVRLTRHWPGRFLLSWSRR
jgi:SAM-dependent methyltransferase